MSQSIRIQSGLVPPLRELANENNRSLVGETNHALTKHVKDNGKRIANGLKPTRKRVIKKGKECAR